MCSFDLVSRFRSFDDFLLIFSDLAGGYEEGIDPPFGEASTSLAKHILRSSKLERHPLVLKSFSRQKNNPQLTCPQALYHVLS